MEYPWRFEGPKKGDKVFAITVDTKGNRYIDEVTIAKIQDNSYHATINENGEFDGGVERSDDWKDYNIGYLVEEFDLGSALYFGMSLFLTLEESIDILEDWDEEGEDHV